MIIKLMMPLYHPEEGADNSSIEDKSLGISDMTELLGEGDIDEEINKDDEQLDGKEEDKKNKKDDKEKDENQEEELELNPEDDDVKFEDVPSLKAINKEFPELLKKFPALKSVYYREQQYSEIYPTVIAARESVEKVKQYDAFEDSLLSGNIKEILSSVKQADGKAFTKITEHILNTIGDIDKNAQLEIAGRVAKDIAIAMSRSDDDNVKLAARWMHKFLFNDDKITGYNLTTSNEPDKKDDKVEQLNQREQEFVQYQLDTAVQNVSTRVENLVRKSIENAIDTKNQMTPYVKNKAIDDIISELDKEINGDRRFKQYLDSEWETAGKNRFAESHLNNIRNAIIRKAKPILPNIVRRVKAEALKGHAAREDREENNSGRLLPRGRVANERKSSNDNSNGNRDTKKSAIPRGMSSRDYLMSDD
jgi:hypothetical protein